MTDAFKQQIQAEARQAVEELLEPVSYTHLTLPTT